jgi:hypothetical protein
MHFGKTLINTILRFAIPLLIILGVSFWSLWAVLQSPSNALVNAGDDILITWIIGQHIEKIPGDLPNIFDGNIFYPYKNTLAYSDFFLPSALIAYVPVKLTQLPILGYNLNLLVGQALTIAVLYLWFLEITKNKLSSLVASVAFGVSQIRIHYYAHLQMWSLQWFLLASWMFWKFTHLKKTRFLYLSGFFIVIQFWESVLPVYFFITIAGFILLTNRQVLKNNWKHFLGAFVLVVILIFPLLKTYLQVSTELGVARSIRDAAHFSMSLDDVWRAYFSPGLYLVFIISLLTVSDKIFGKNKVMFWLLSVMLFGFIMSLGPVLKWEGSTFKIFDKLFLPLPYGFFYFMVPGFTALRTPLRWFWLSGFAASGMISVILSFYKSKVNNLVFIGLFFIALLGGRKVPVVATASAPSDYPRVYEFIESLPKDVVLELPIYTWGQGESAKEEFWRMLYSLKHKKELVNGFTGLMPEERQELIGEIENDFPDPGLILKLSNIGVDYVVVHKDKINDGKIKEIKIWGESKNIWEDSRSFVLEI